VKFFYLFPSLFYFFRRSLGVALAWFTAGNIAPANMGEAFRVNTVGALAEAVKSAAVFAAASALF